MTPYEVVSVDGDIIVKPQSAANGEYPALYDSCRPTVLLTVDVPSHTERESAVSAAIATAPATAAAAATSAPVASCRLL